MHEIIKKERDAEIYEPSTIRLYLSLVVLLSFIILYVLYVIFAGYIYIIHRNTNSGITYSRPQFIFIVVSLIIGFLLLPLTIRTFIDFWKSKKLSISFHENAIVIIMGDYSVTISDNKNTYILYTKPSLLTIIWPKNESKVSAIRLKRYLWGNEKFEAMCHRLRIYKGFSDNLQYINNVLKQSKYDIKL